MAFECGTLASSRGLSNRDVLQGILQYLQGRGIDIQPGELKQGENWVGVYVRVVHEGSEQIEPYIQVYVGGDVVDFYRSRAAAVHGVEAIDGRDAMVKIMTTGARELGIAELVLGYLTENQGGLLWDESSGFHPA